LINKRFHILIHTYEWSEDKSGGLGVAEKLPELADRVFNKKIARSLRLL